MPPIRWFITAWIDPEPKPRPKASRAESVQAVTAPATATAPRHVVDQQAVVERAIAFGVSLSGGRRSCIGASRPSAA